MQTRAASLWIPKLKIFEQKVPYTISATNNYSNKCFDGRPGARLSGEKNSRNVACGGTELTYKHFKVVSSELALLTFSKQREMILIHFQIDNTTTLRYLLKIQGTKNKKFIDLNKKIWTYLFFSGDHHYSRISSQCNE